MAGGMKRARQAEDGGAAERNGKQSRRPTKAEDSEETEYRLLCPGEKVGSLIGKGGSIIKSLRAECKCKIRVEDRVAAAEERVVLISAASDQVKQGSQYVCASQEALFKVYARITEPVDDEEGDSGQIVVRLLVPKSYIGCILGKGGKIIEQMRKEIGAQIRILPKEQLPACAGDTDELVQIVGDEPTVRRALFAISTRLHENVTGERSFGGSGAPPAPIYGAGSMLYPSSGYLAPTASFYGPSAVGGPVSGLGYSFPTYGGGYAHADGASEEQLTIRILCPNVRIGSIIGKGGSVIKKMREDTGAKIKVEDEVPDCDERVVRISSTELGDGPSPSIQAALGVYQRLVEIQMDKDQDNRSFIVRLLVPSNKVGCLIGKGGSVVTELRKVTKANIRISSKEEPLKCAEEDDELVQVMGDEVAVYDALLQILSLLRSNLFKGQDSRDSGLSHGSSVPQYSASAYLGSSYPLTHVGRYGFGGL